MSAPLSAGLSRTEPAAVHSPDRAAIQSWTGSGIATEIQTKPVANAYRKWTSFRNARRLRLRDMLSMAPSTFDDMMLVQKFGNDFVVVDMSENYIRNVGRDMRGFTLSEFSSSTAEAMKRLYDSCLTQKEPIYCRFISELSAQVTYWEKLSLPLAVDDSGRPNFVLNYVTELNEKSDLLQVLYDRAPVGMVAAVPTFGNGANNDGRILCMNEKARKILRIPPNGSQLHFVSDLMPWLRDVTQWTRVETITNGPQSQMIYRDATGARFIVTVELINRFILITIAPPEGTAFVD